MTLISLEDGRPILKDGRIGTEQACCCTQPCDCTDTGYLPAIPSDSERGLVWLEFSSSCIGTGAAATVDAPAAFTPCDWGTAVGPISDVTLTSGGSGYAALGRVEPTISASVAGGTGATLSVTLSEQSEYLNPATECLPAPWWKVASVSVTNGGTGYTDDAAVTFTAAGGDSTLASAAGRAYVDIDEPENETFTIDTASGSGAVLSAVWELLPSGEWASPRSANPCTAPKKKTYRLVSVSITNGGSGYAQFETISIGFPTADDGIVAEFGDAYIDIDTVDGSGAITAVFVAPNDGNFIPGPAGRYVGSVTDVLVEVVVNSCVESGEGKYYREDASEPPYVSTVTVSVNQEAPSSGNDANVTATVDDDTSSPTFGTVSALTLVDGGTGYVDASAACNYPDTLYIEWNGVTRELPILVGGGVIADFGICGSNIGTPEDPCPIGTAGSRAFGIIEDMFCKCGGKLHMRIEVQFECFECISVGEMRRNFVSSRSACARFEVDEEGCPVGDAVVFEWAQTARTIWTGCIGDGPQCLGCRAYLAADGETLIQNELNGGSGPCPCEDECDEEFAPTISLMP